MKKVFVTLVSMAVLVSVVTTSAGACTSFILKVDARSVLAMTLLLFIFPILAFGAESSQQLFGKYQSTDQITIYTAKEIVTMAHSPSRATAVAVRNGKIIDLGDKELLLKKFKGNPDATLDERFAEKVITPGLIDPHLHLWLFALVSNAQFITPADWDLPWGSVKGVVGHEGYMKRLKDYEASLKNPDELLFTWGYHQYFHGKLTRQMLDKEISSTRPIIVWQRSAHELIFNSNALEMMGLKKSDWQGKGESSSMANWEEGHVWEKGLYLAVNELFKIVASPERFKLGMERARDYVHAGGITACADPGVLLTREMTASMIQILESKTLPFKYYMIPAGNVIYDGNGKDAAKAVSTAKEMVKTGGEHAKWVPDQIKLFLDGAVYSQLMQMKDGYLDGHHGEWMQSPEDFADCAQAFWDSDYQIIVHVNGDLGMQVAMDVLANLQLEYPRYDHRFRIDHFAYSQKEQVRRAAELGGLISSNPFYLYLLGEQYSKFGVGPERSEVMTRGRTVLDNGIKLSFHSDSPMAPARPMLLAWSAVNRLGLSGKRVLGKKEKLTIEEAFRAVTIDAAYAINKENEMGSIEIGKRANFTVFDENPLDVKPGRLKDIEIWGTVMDGRIYPIKPASRRLTMTPTDQKRLAMLDEYDRQNNTHGGLCEANYLLQSVARHLSEENRVGRIKQGMLVDLVILDQNPIKVTDVRQDQGHQGAGDH